MEKFISELPQHTRFVELYSTASAIVYYKPKSSLEVINDINGFHSNLFSVLQTQTEKQESQVKKVLFEDNITKNDVKYAGDVLRNPLLYNPLIRAWAMKVYINSHNIGQRGFWGLDIAALNKDCFPISKVADRLKAVQFEGRTEDKLIEGRDTKETLFFADLPSKSIRGYEYYAGKDVKNLFDMFKSIQGKFICVGFTAESLIILAKKYPFNIRNKQKGSKEIIITNY